MVIIARAEDALWATVHLFRSHSDQRSSADLPSRNLQGKGGQSGLYEADRSPAPSAGAHPRRRVGEAVLLKQGVGLHPAATSFHSQPRGLPLVGS